MQVKIIANYGNPYYDQFIGQTFEASLTSRGMYLIATIKTKSPVQTQNPNILKASQKFVGTQWAEDEVEVLA